MLGDLIAQHFGMMKREHLLQLLHHSLTLLGTDSETDYVGFWQGHPFLSRMTVVLH